VAKIAAVTIVLDTLHDDGDKSRENTEAAIYPLAAEASQRNASYILNPVATTQQKCRKVYQKL
jgi:hypothetical protein